MKKSLVIPGKVVVLSGAGMSAPSGLSTFRDSGGLWHSHRIEDVATPEAWRRQPDVVLEFYNQRRTQAGAAAPNAGHLAIAALEECFDVVVVTQNVDDLHERAGSKNVLHLHGELTKARSTTDPSLIYPIGNAPMRMGDRCARGSQLRPHIVWFGEDVPMMEDAVRHIREASIVLVAGTSLTVYPAAGLVEFADRSAEKYLVDLHADTSPDGFQVLKGSVDVILPPLIEEWLNRGRKE